MDRKPLVSCIITTCNRGAILRRAIDSVLKQSYENIECIVIDDCPCAETYENVEGYLSKCDNVRYLKNSVNLGPLGARNKAVKEAAGDYIAFLDDDDYWHNEKIYRQISYADKYSAVSCVPLICSSNMERPQKAEFKGKVGVYNTRNLFQSTRHIYPSGLLMKKENFVKIGGFDVDFVEHDFFYKLSKEVGDMVVLADNLVYFDRSENLERVSGNDEAYRRLLMVYLKYQEEIPEDIFRLKMRALYKKRAALIQSNLKLKLAMYFMSIAY